MTDRSRLSVPTQVKTIKPIVKWHPPHPKNSLPHQALKPRNVGKHQQTQIKVKVNMKIIINLNLGLHDNGRSSATCLVKSQSYCNVCRCVYISHLPRTGRLTGLMSTQNAPLLTESHVHVEFSLCPLQAGTLVINYIVYKPIGLPHITWSETNQHLLSTY